VELPSSTEVVLSDVVKLEARSCSRRRDVVASTLRVVVGTVTTEEVLVAAFQMDVVSCVFGSSTSVVLVVLVVFVVLVVVAVVEAKVEVDVNVTVSKDVVGSEVLVLRNFASSVITNLMWNSALEITTDWFPPCVDGFLMSLTDNCNSACSPLKRGSPTKYNCVTSVT